MKIQIKVKGLKERDILLIKSFFSNFINKENFKRLLFNRGIKSLTQNKNGKITIIRLDNTLFYYDSLYNFLYLLKNIKHDI